MWVSKLFVPGRGPVFIYWIYSQYSNTKVRIETLLNLIYEIPWKGVWFGRVLKYMLVLYTVVYWLKLYFYIKLI